MVMKTFLKSSDKSDEQFLKREKRTMGRGEVIKQSSVTEPAQQHSGLGLSAIRSGSPKQHNSLSLVGSQRAQAVSNLQVK